MNHQQQNHSLRMDSSRRHQRLKYIFTNQIFAQYSGVVKTQILFSLRGGFLTYAMFQHRETIKSEFTDSQCYGKPMF